MVRPPRADPGAARVPRLDDREFRRVFDHQMAHGVVAVDQGGAGGLRDCGDGRGNVDAAGADALHVLRKAEDAVGVEPRQIRRHHQAAAICRVACRQTDVSQCAGDEIFKLGGGKPPRRRLRHSMPFLLARAILLIAGSIPRRGEPGLASGTYGFHFNPPLFIRVGACLLSTRMRTWWNWYTQQT